MGKLNTTYLGLELKNPLVASSSPLTNSPDSVEKLEQAGIGAIVVKSIFEEQIRSDVSDMYDALEGESSGFAMEYLRADLPAQLGPEAYLDTIRAMRKRVKIPIICSVNCVEAAQWVNYARKIEDVGADALELNLYHMPVNPNETSAQVEARYAALVESVMKVVKLPVAVKLSKHFTALMPFARVLDGLGVKGLVLFNRFLQTDVDIENETMFYAPNYSTPNILHEQLRWTALLRDWVRCDLAVSGGIHGGAELAKALLVGANVGYVCSALLVRQEMGVIREILDGLEAWMARKGYASLADFQGKLREIDQQDGHGFERSQYVKAATQLA
jgi:dihydroorotate dehydrogenase (fumarate)